MCTSNMFAYPSLVGLHFLFFWGIPLLGDVSPMNFVHRLVAIHLTIRLGSDIVVSNLEARALECPNDFIRTYRGFRGMNHGIWQAYRKRENTSIYQLIIYINYLAARYFMLISTTYAAKINKKKPSPLLAAKSNEPGVLLGSGTKGLTSTVT